MLFRSKKNIGDGSINARADDVIGAGKDYRSFKLTLIDSNGKKLKSNTDYEVDTDSITSPDEKRYVNITVKGKGSYSGTRTLKYRYLTKSSSLSETTRSKLDSKVYTGSEIELDSNDVSKQIGRVHV